MRPCRPRPLLLTALLFCISVLITLFMPAMGVVTVDSEYWSDCGKVTEMLYLENVKYIDTTVITPNSIITVGGGYSKSDASSLLAQMVTTFGADGERDFSSTTKITNGVFSHSKKITQDKIEIGYRGFGNNSGEFINSVVANSHQRLVTLDANLSSQDNHIESKPSFSWDGETYLSPEMDYMDIEITAQSGENKMNALIEGEAYNTLEHNLSISRWVNMTVLPKNTAIDNGTIQDQYGNIFMSLTWLTDMEAVEVAT